MTRRMFWAILPSQIFMILMTNLNSIIDSFFAGHYLSNEGLSAIGFYSPISNVVYFCYIFITGAQILICQQLGKGNRDNVDCIFNTSGIIILLYGILITISFIFFGDQMSFIVGASGTYGVAFKKYLLGLSIGVPFLMLQCYFMSFLKINERNNLVVISIASMVIINTLLDYLFIILLHVEILGLAIATTITNVITSTIGFIGFISFGKHSLAIRLAPHKFNLKILPEVVKNGLTQLSFNASLVINNLLINYILIFAGGNEAVTLMTVFNTINTFVGAVNSGIQEAELNVGSIYFGMKNRNGFIDAFRFGFRLDMILLGVAYVTIFILAKPLSLIYFSAEEELFNESANMLRIAMLFTFPAGIVTTYCASYQCQSKLAFPNMVHYLSMVLRLSSIAILAKIIGLNGIWCGMIVGNVLVLIVNHIYACIKRHRLTLRFDDTLLLDDDFGAAKECVFEKKLTSLNDTTKTAELVQTFCKERGCNEKTSYHISLCCEELLGNIFEYGKIKNVEANLYVVIDSVNNFIIQIMDNCKEFDPVAYLNQFKTDDPIKNLGLKIVSKISDKMKYQRFLGINFITIIKE